MSEFTDDRKLASLVRSEATNPPTLALHAPTDWRARAARWLPALLLLGFAALVIVLFGERLLPARELRFEGVVALRAGDDSGTAAASSSEQNPWEGPMLFQASGWVEPDPLPIKATTLIDGVVDKVYVLDGETVEEGQLLATLIAEDAELNLRTAKSRADSLAAQTASHDRRLEIIDAEIATLKKQVIASEARREELADLVRRYEDLSEGSVPDREIAQARLQLTTQEAQVDALETTEHEFLAKRLQHHEMQRDFEAKLEEAHTEVDRRQLDLDRTQITSPIDGVVLHLFVAPGQKRMLRMDDPDSTTIATLYHPDRLQARIDVPLEEAAQLAVDQPVRIRSNFLPDRTFQGTVTSIVGEADLQRNTLQAKVRIHDPDPRLRPEMLCRAEFLARPAGEDGGESRDSAGGFTSPERVRLFVPEAALTGTSGDLATVWRLDDSGERIEQASLRLAPERRDDHRLVLEGLRPGDRVVLNPPDDLEEGQRARPLP